ncbi:hypothetical protein [Sphingobium fluviale]|uniref:DUF3617 family protein n=1 Tax=Sphingobium fluviale TaxID=2506423 RepID=A0A4Q1KD33_9SPHN|nr:hypothetical protein [Sphingobium fluviale]RXR25544.1 hypothetical protein EQG66_14020 [Sphingobium fluviale]
MKILLTIAATLAAFASVSVQAANDRGPGHWEWKSRPTHGPSKSNLPARVRVWVKDDQAKMANCDCDMMKVAPADCMMTPGKGASSSKG